MSKKRGVVRKTAGRARARSRSARNKIVRSGSAMKWIGTGDLALRCGVTSQTIRNDIERGKLTARQNGAGRYVIPRDVAEKYIYENGYANAVGEIGC
jgi:hypothetical protein